MYDYMTYRKVLAILRNLQSSINRSMKMSIETFEDENNDICVTSTEIVSENMIYGEAFCLIWASFKTDEEQELPKFFFRMNENTCEIGNETAKIDLQKSESWRAILILFCKKISEHI